MDLRPAPPAAGTRSGADRPISDVLEAFFIDRCDAVFAVRPIVAGQCVETDRRVDERNVRERLREVANLTLMMRVVLLGKQPNVVAQREQALEQGAGVALTVAVEGNTPLVAEIQTLAAPTAFPYPRRTARGVDINKLHLFSAVVEKRCRIPSSSWDIYVNVTGGLNLQEPAADLALCAALASAVRDAPLASGSCFIGEVGLAGEIRPVTRFPLRLREAARNGFTQVYASSLQEARVSGVSREKDLWNIRVVAKSRVFEVLEEVMR